MKTDYQFETIEQVEEFLAQKDSGTLDNIWENICDEFGYDDEESCVAEFNKALKEH